MASAVMAGLAVFGAVGGGAVTAGAVAAGIAVAAGTMLMEQAMAPDAPDTQSAVALGDTGQQIDKAALQKEAKIGDLDIGENEKDKKKRKKGKAAFKVELDKANKAKKDGVDPSSGTGIQVAAKPKLGVQL